PRSLDLLVPTYLPTLPRDLMGGRPLQYTLKAGQVPTLYSVGTDGEDNGGDGSSDQVGKFGLWEGRDAVWPAGEAGGESTR
ncbi:MAG TPA: hypothetical protein VHI52_18495, partial [Verrucomicrobiae bacterium]|nr:hypothetical protein [Verrucomicrobiae bacterium]